MTDYMSFEVIHNQDANRFEVDIDGHLAMIDYWPEDGRIVFVHTGVPPALEGRGIASAMARTALEYAREAELVVVPRCPFVRGYIERHPEYMTLVNPPQTKPWWKIW